jgi:hypothetical protein
MKNILIIMIASMFFLSCRTTEYRYVVRRDVADVPSFVVLSFNNSQEQIQCANIVESALIASGVKVLRSPEVKKVETKREAGLGQVQSDKEIEGEPPNNVEKKSLSIDGMDARESRVEKYYQYSEIKANYIIETNGVVSFNDGEPSLGDIYVSIYRKGEDELIASFISDSGDMKKDVYNILKSLGVKVIYNNELEPK